MTEMTHHEAVRRAWNAAERAERRTGSEALYDAARARAWAAVAAQLPFEQLQAESQPERPSATMFGYVLGSGVKPLPHQVASARAFLAGLETEPRPVPADAVRACEEIITAVEPVPVPRPLERRDPTNTQTVAEHEAAQAALRGEDVLDPRADETAVLSMPNTAVPQPGTVAAGRAVCMCGIGIYWNKVAWCHDNGGGICPR